jgi:hypothetical protein
MSLSLAATGGWGTFGGLSRRTKADLMKAHEAVAGGCGPRSCEGEAQTSVWATGVVPGTAVMSILNKSGKKAEQVLKHKGLKLSIKKGQCLENLAANLLKEKKPR